MPTNEPVSATDVMRLRALTGLPVLECKRMLEQATPSERDEFLHPVVESETGLRRDPIELDPDKASLIRKAEIATEKELANSEYRDQTGFCHLFWNTQKRILKERYSIDWRTPAEMNPEIIID